MDLENYIFKNKATQTTHGMVNQHSVNDISLVVNVFVSIKANIIVPYTTVFRFLSTWTYYILTCSPFFLNFYQFLLAIN